MTWPTRLSTQRTTPAKSRASRHIRSRHKQTPARHSETGVCLLLAEAEGFEPSMGFKPQTRLAGGRHKPG